MHNAIELYLHSSFFECNNDIVLEEENEALSPITIKYKWSEEEAVKFVESVSNDKLLEIENDLDMLLKLDNIDYDNVECISGRFCKLIDEVEAECNMKKEFSANINASVLNQKKPMKKKWFNNTCKMKRKDYRRAKNRYHSCKSMDNNLDVMKNTRKSYKVAIKFAMKNFQKKFNKKLRLLRNSNPKE